MVAALVEGMMVGTAVAAQVLSPEKMAAQREAREEHFDTYRAHVR